jgi:hypothetical protein
VIPYAFADLDDTRGIRAIGGIRDEWAFPSRIKQAIIKAMKRWEQLTKCIHFVPWRDEADYVLIRLWETGGADADCVGRRTIVSRPITIVTPGGGDKIGGQIKFTIGGFDPSKPGYPRSFRSIPHELGHIIGLEHEHYRSGSNLIPGNDIFSEHAKETVKRAQPPRCVERGGYDMKSIIHYECAPGFVWRPGQKPQPGLMNMPSETEVIEGTWSPSQGDISAVQLLYSGAGP